MRDFFLKRLCTAHARFQSGLLLNEEPLMSHVCAESQVLGTFLHLGASIQMHSHPAIMHRKGIDGTDKFGCDLAWTVRVFGARMAGGTLWRKTAFFQLKRLFYTAKGKRPSVSVEHKQLHDAHRPGFWERAFVVAVDHDSAKALVSDCASIAVKKNVSGKTTIDCTTASWMKLDDWLQAWFECSVGVRETESKEARLEATRENPEELQSPHIRVWVDTRIEMVDRGGQG
ncbi:MAG: hypothetical protein IT435_04430 [Phycisphaerales bacterium]|nr:hypothetical protein [Phycisphaerales bacterium]